MRIYLIILFMTIACLSLFAETKASLFPVPQIPFAPKSDIINLASGPISIDGKMDEKDWQDAKWTTPFLDIVGDSKPKPCFETKTKMLWDNEYLYIAAEMEEPDLWATLTQRDAVIFHDNDFEVFIDPDGDTHNYYELEINALNTVWDLFLTMPYRDADRVALNGWDINGLKTAVHLNGTLNNPSDIDTGWTVEIAIPWKALGEFAPRVPPQDGDTWRMNFSRVEWKDDTVNGQYVKQKDNKGNPLPEDNWVWSPQGLVAMHYPEMWGYVEFSYQNLNSGEWITPLVASNHDSEVKDYLRKLYYKEKEYYLQNVKYDPNPWKNIRFAYPKNIQKPNLPLIEITSRSFVARYTYPGENRTWYINHEGKTWVEEIK